MHNHMAYHSARSVRTQAEDVYPSGVCPSAACSSLWALASLDAGQCVLCVGVEPVETYCSPLTSEYYTDFQAALPPCQAPDLTLTLPIEALGCTMDARLMLAEENTRLATTLQHYRNWASQILARYQMVNPDAAKPPRRIYVGGLPPGTTEAALRQFINEVMIRTGAVAAAGFPIITCKVYAVDTSPSFLSGKCVQLQGKNYAFLEFRSVEEASNCMAFDGVVFNDAYLRIRRPNNYDYNVAVTLGFTEPNPVIDLSQLEIVRTVVQDTPHKLFIGGLPCEWTEDQVKDKLSPYGPLRAFNLVMDKQTGNSKGYAFCEYQYPELTDVVIDALNLTSVGTKTLTVKRAVVSGQPQGPQTLPYLPPSQIASAVTGAFSSQYRRLQQEATQALIGPSIGTLSLA